MSKKYNFTKEELEKAVNKSFSMAETHRNLNIYYHSGAGYKILKKQINDYNINTSHWNSFKSLTQNFKKTPTEELLIENSTFSVTNLKKRLVKEELLQWKCYESNCPLHTNPLWKQKSITFQLDHINGNRTDNRLENLRLLCPNCHSQTSTFSIGHNFVPKKYNCTDCNIEIHRKSIRCNKCNQKANPQKTKINWPSFEDLKEMLKESNYTQVAKKLGVTDNSIRKRFWSRGLKAPK